MLRYRVDPTGPYVSKVMTARGHIFSATVKGSELPAGPYGALGFSITANDSKGRSTRSPVDASVRLLPCVGA